MTADDRPAAWAQVLQLLAQLGVEEWTAIREVLEAAGEDERTIAVTAVRWHQVLADVAQAAEGPAWTRALRNLGLD